MRDTREHPSVGVRAMTGRDLLRDTSPSNLMADLVGPFYNSNQVGSLLQLDDDAVRGLIARGGVVGMQTADGVWVFPTFQFKGQAVRDDLMQVLRVLAGHNAWSSAVWLRTPHPDLDDITPERWLADRGDQRTVLDLARDAASRRAG